MTQEELYEVVRNWSNEKIGERSATFVLVEKDNEDEITSYSTVIGQMCPLIDGMTKTIEQNEEFMLLVSTALVGLNDDTFNKILSSVAQIRLMNHTASKDKK